MKHSHCVKYEIKIALVPFRNEGSAALFNYRYYRQSRSELERIFEDGRFGKAYV